MKKILVVDDEAYIVELVKFNLEKEGYQVIVASDGRNALKMVQTEQPDLVLLDIMLPNIDGLEVCRILKQSPDTNSIPIIMLTAVAGWFECSFLGYRMTFNYLQITRY
jgi:two-component system alkaline phosphatase synthesis response regulator PhoP